MIDRTTDSVLQHVAPLLATRDASDCGLVDAKHSAKLAVADAGGDSATNLRHSCSVKLGRPVTLSAPDNLWAPACPVVGACRMALASFRVSVSGVVGTGPEEQMCRVDAWRVVASMAHTCRQESGRSFRSTTLDGQVAGDLCRLLFGHTRDASFLPARPNTHQASLPDTWLRISREGSSAQTYHMIDRTPDAVLALVAAIDVANNFAFLSHRRVIDGNTTALITLCNSYAVVFFAALGCPIPNMKANDQTLWLASSEGLVSGWTSCDAEQALKLANLGRPVCAAAVNPNGHGHIAAVVPSPHDDPGHLYVSAAGRQNFPRVRIERSFGDLRPTFFNHP